MTEADYTSAVLADSPWGYWRMHETSGSSMADSSAGGHNGVYPGTVSSVAGPFTGWLAQFVNANYPNVSGAISLSTAIAVEGWWKLSLAGNFQSMAFTYQNAANTLGVELGAEQVSGCGDKAALAITSPNYGWACTAANVFTDSEWTYAVLQLEGDGHWRLYFRRPSFSSTQVQDFGAHSMNSVSSAILTFGQRAAGTVQFKGSITHGALYDHPLSSTRINAHWAAAVSTGPPPPPCQYGTRAKATSPILGMIGNVALSALMTRFNLSWFEQTLLQVAMQQIDIQQLCSTLPPTPPPPPPDALNYPPYKLLEWLYPIVWDTWCECTPGATTPVNPPDPNFGPGTGFQGPYTYLVNPTNPCLDLTEVRKKLDSVLRLLNVDVQLDQLLQRYDLPFATIPGAQHIGLAGTGSFPIADLIGVQIVITAHPPGRQLEGAPAYVWDLGWASCMDGNGFIQERRITREVEVWQPRLFQQATTFGYMFKEGVIANVIELKPES